MTPSTVARYTWFGDLDNPKDLDFFITPNAIVAPEQPTQQHPPRKQLMTKVKKEPLDGDHNTSDDESSDDDVQSVGSDYDDDDDGSNSNASREEVYWSDEE